MMSYAARVIPEHRTPCRTAALPNMEIMMENDMKKSAIDRFNDAYIPIPLIDRFNEKYELIPFDTCWHWTGSTDTNGYGRIRGGGEGGGKVLPAHRFSYEYHIGPIPEGMYICHTCDVKSCVNPKHLFPGTQKDNMDDMRAKDRQPGKLNWRKVSAIRYLQGFNVSETRLAVFGVSRASIGRVKRKEAWKTR